MKFQKQMMVLSMAAAMIAGALSSAAAMAATVDCGSLQNSVSAAGYFVSGNPIDSTDRYEITFSHVENTDGSDTNIDQKYDVTATYGSDGRLMELVGNNFEMKYVSDYDSASDVQRGFYTVTATLKNGETVNVGANKYLMCGVGL